MLYLTMQPSFSCFRRNFRSFTRWRQQRLVS